MREILRNFIQPLSSPDAQKMEQEIESSIMKGETITPDALKALRDKLSAATEVQNMQRISQDLEQLLPALRGLLQQVMLLPLTGLVLKVNLPTVWLYEECVGRNQYRYKPNR